MTIVKTTIKKIFFSFTFLLIVVIAGLFLYGHFYGDDVKKTILGELNEQLNVKLEVEKIRFSLLENFPNGSVQFTGVRSKETLSKGKNQLIDAGEISLMFNIMNLVTGNYIIDKIEIDMAYLNLEDFEDSATNLNMLAG